MKKSVNEKLQKFLSRCGYGSRRECEKIIEAGRVKINGQTVLNMGERLDPHLDSVSVDGKRVTPVKNAPVFLLNRRIPVSGTFVLRQ